MDSNSTPMKIDQITPCLEDLNSACTDLERSQKYLVDDPPSNENEFSKWAGKDSKAQAITGLTLSDELLENVCEVKFYKKNYQFSTREVWNFSSCFYKAHSKQFALSELHFSPKNCYK